MPRKISDAVIIHGTSHPELARKLSEFSGIPLAEAQVEKFANGEIELKGIKENVRRKHVFLLQSPRGKEGVNDHLMEAFVIASALKRHGAREITLVIPQFAYARQERITAERGPVTAKLVVDLFHAAGVHNFIAVDLHAKAIQGFTPESFENISTLRLVKQDIEKKFKKLNDVVFVATDKGSSERNEKLAKIFGTAWGMFEKHRPEPNVSEVRGYLGPDLKGKHVIICEDMIDTGGTLLNTAAEAKKMGAKSVTVYATHGVFSPDKKTGQRAQDKINNSAAVDRVVVTDTIDVKPEGKIEVLKISPFLAKVLIAHHKGESISKLMKIELKKERG
ncbi:MAG: ribose-phosphate diphosphokinase [Candidatus Micrarchaeia archaeon]|jgi:ribose-phosphate pyrophosphokinase